MRLWSANSRAKMKSRVGFCLFGGLQLLATTALPIHLMCRLTYWALRRRRASVVTKGKP